MVLVAAVATNAHTFSKHYFFFNKRFLFSGLFSKYYCLFSVTVVVAAVDVAAMGAGRLSWWLRRSPLICCGTFQAHERREFALICHDTTKTKHHLWWFVPHRRGACQAGSAHLFCHRLVGACCHWPLNTALHTCADRGYVFLGTDHSREHYYNYCTLLWHQRTCAVLEVLCGATHKVISVQY